MSKLLESGENYLETILQLSQNSNGVRSIDIAHEMNFSKPSVSRAVNLLKNGGFINIDKDGFITLTSEGKKVAEKIYERHRIISKWLINLGVDEKTALQDACKIEHDLSELSFEKLKEHIIKSEKMQ